MVVTTRLVVFAVALLVTAGNACFGADPAGYNSILDTRLQVGMLGLAAIRQAAADAGYETVRSGSDEIAFRFTGRTNNVAVIRALGDISIRSTREVKSLDDVDRLYADLMNAYNLIAKVSPEIPDRARAACLYFDPRFRLSNPKVLKRIVFPFGSYEGNIIVPECKVKSARVVILPTPDVFVTVHLRGQQLYRKWTGESATKSIDVSDKLVFGSHQFEMSMPTSQFSHGSVAVELITEPTPNLVYYQGGGLENVITTAVLPLSAKPSTAPGGDSTGEGTPASEDVGEVPDGATYVVPVDLAKTQELADIIAKQASDAEDPAKPKKLAIMDFELIPEKSGTHIDQVVARNVREDLATAMSAVKCFKVLERSQLSEALKNLKLEQTAIIDQETAKKLGKMVSADYVLVGSVSDRGNAVVVQARMIDAEKGETAYTARVEMARTRKKSSPEGGAGTSAPPSGRSLKEIEEAISRNPGDAGAYADLAAYYDAGNDAGRCVGALGKALQLDPERFAARSAVYDRLAPIIRSRGDMLTPTIRLVRIESSKTVPVEDGAKVSAKDNSLAIEVLDDSDLAGVELFVGDSPFPRGTWSLQGKHAALIKLRSPWTDRSMIGPRVPVGVKVADAANRKNSQKLTLRVTQ